MINFRVEDLDGLLVLLKQEALTRWAKHRNLNTESVRTSLIRKGIK